MSSQRQTRVQLIACGMRTRVRVRVRVRVLGVGLGSLSHGSWPQLELGGDVPALIHRDDWVVIRVVLQYPRCVRSGAIRQAAAVLSGATASGATELAGVAASAAKSPIGAVGEIISAAASEMRVDLTLAERPSPAPSGTSRLLAMVFAEGATAGDESGCATMRNSQCVFDNLDLSHGTQTRAVT